VLLALTCAFGAMLAYGVATVLQSVGARRAAGSDTLDLTLVLRLARQGPYVVGLALDVVGVALTVVALRRLPLFVVQAAIAGSLAVTALVASRVVDTRLSRAEWTAIAAVGVGLVLVASSAGAEAPPATSTAARLVLLGMVVVVGVLAVVAGRVRGSRGAVWMGAMAGLGFGLGNTALRIIPDLAPRAVLTNVATPVAIGGALLGVLAFATALQRGETNVVNAVSVVSQTFFPALYEAFFLGDRPRPGWWPVAVAGFVVTIAAAVALARFAEVPTD
jgi:drug/metabolite transporter (DMT)-like permease